MDQISYWWCPFNVISSVFYLLLLFCLLDSLGVCFLLLPNMLASNLFPHRKHLTTDALQNAVKPESAPALKEVHAVLTCVWSLSARWHRYCRTIARNSVTQSHAAFIYYLIFKYPQNAKITIVTQYQSYPIIWWNLPPTTFILFIKSLYLTPKKYFLCNAFITLLFLLLSVQSWVEV